MLYFSERESLDIAFVPGIVPGMASLHRRKDSPYWIAAYTDAHGRRLKKSTKSTDYAEAGQIAREWEEAIRLVKKKRQVAKQHQTVLQEIHDQPKTSAAAPPENQSAADPAPNQREIASRLGISQATVSMALRGDRSISQTTRRKIHEAAVDLGYHPNAYVNVLMSRIRSGKKLSEKGTVAMLVDSSSLAVWHIINSYRAFHEGVTRRGKELGFHVEPFFLRAPDMDDVKIDRILRARGIQGVILAPPYWGNRSLRISWKQYAVVGIGFGWEEQEFDRVAYDNLHNYITAFNALRHLGYRRIGTVLDDKFLKEGSGVKWYTGYLDCQGRLPGRNRVPVCEVPTVSDSTRKFDIAIFTPSIEIEDGRKNSFLKWFKKWRPDALLTIAGYEYAVLQAIGIQCPEDIGLACLAETAIPGLANIDEKGGEVGATALEWVASKIARNEYGPPRCPKVTMVEGEWVAGWSVRKPKRR